MRGGFLRLGLRDARHRLPFGEGLSEGRGNTMSEENKEVAGKEAVSAAGIPGVGGGGGGGESVDWRRAEEAERELNKARVEQGRVKSLAQRNRELEEELAKVRSAKAHDALPEELRESVSDETAQAAEHIARHVTDPVRQEFLERDSRTRADIDRIRGEIIDYKIDAAFPGFRQAVDAGGKLESAWRKFLSVDGPSVANAYGSGNMAALGVLISRFYNEAGVPAPRGNPSAVAEPFIAAGGGEGQAGSVQGKVYTQSEFEEENRRIQRDLARGLIDKKEYDRIDAELFEALNQGRVR